MREQNHPSPLPLENTTILVAGAAGFIPSHLSYFYLDLGAKVIGLDNLATGSLSNIQWISQSSPRHKNFVFHERDISEGLPDFKDQAIDYIFSLASPASPADFSAIPLEIMKVNSQGTWNLLELAHEKGARFLLGSTSEVYGDPDVSPQREDYPGRVNTIGPRACYDESKRFAEALTMSFHRKHDVSTRIVRIFNTYGPRMRPHDGRMIPNFINQALQGKPLTLYGDGLQTRSLCFISDLIQAIDKVMFCKDPMPFPINCGNPDEFTVKECAEIVIKLLGGGPSPLVYLPLPQDDPKQRRPDITQLQSLTGFQPRVSFEEGLKQTAAYFQSFTGQS